MERELEKTLMEIECAIKNNEQRGNTHTQSVLEQAQEIIEMCAKAARTPSDLKEILERDAAKAPIKDTNSGVRYTDDYICPNCGKHFIGTGIAEFCYHCGQRLKWEEL